MQGDIEFQLKKIKGGFEKLDKIEEPSRKRKKLNELMIEMTECKTLIKNLCNEMKGEDQSAHIIQQHFIKELNSYVELKKRYVNDLKMKVNVSGMGAGVGEHKTEENIQLASSMTNQELVSDGMKTMDKTDQVIEHSKKVVVQTIEVGTQTAAALRGQTEQMGRIVDELDTIHFSMKKASRLVKEIGRQVATDRCIMLFLFLIVCGVVTIIIVKIVNPNNKDIRGIPGLAPPAQARKLLFSRDGRLLS